MIHQTKHPIQIILDLQDDLTNQNYGIARDKIYEYIKNYHCCYFCKALGEHDNCPNIPMNRGQSYFDYTCGYYIDRRTGRNPLNDEE